MLVCLACYEQRIAALLENASHLMVFALDQGRTEPKADLPAPAGGAQALVSLLDSLEVGVLVCGALDRDWEHTLRTSGIRTRSWVGGTVDHVLKGLREGSLPGGKDGETPQAGAGA